MFARTAPGQWFRYCMPYEFALLKATRLRSPLYLPVNRDYKPLGLSKGSVGFVDYEDYVLQAVTFSRDPHALEGIWMPNEQGRLFLYDDGGDSRKDYFARLDKLSAYVVSGIG
jgi:hypothetical protein